MRQSVLLLAIASALAMTNGCKDADPQPKIDASTIDSPAAAECNEMNTAWLTDCTMDSMCNGCLCKAVGHTKFCTKTCTGPADCPAPSTGCAGGFCARP